MYHPIRLLARCGLHRCGLIRPVLASAAAAFTLACTGTASAAQDTAAWPTRPITWVVGWPPGGSADSVTRVLAKHLGERLGQSVVVENRPGASGAIGLNRAASAEPDGNTVVLVPGPVITNTRMPEIGKELAAVTELARGPMVLVGTTARDMPKDVKSLFAAVKAAPDRYDYTSSGNGTSQHLAGELIKQQAGLKMTHIPYKGGSQAALDIISGQVPLGVLGITSILPHVQAGKMRAYAVTTASRSASLPDTPTLGESVLPGFDASQWFVMAVPKGVPDDRVQRLNAAVGEILKLPDVKAAFAAVGVDPSSASPEDTARFVIGDQARWRNLAVKSNLPLN
ncbi:lipoprotein [Bordetella ansorpii]|uniref:Lipoprotein n=1 Tax=Bordetella ansorpii TaxID=288768 RepID=A0A157NNH8_9BORD|nr:tripartite tricarboxylate transporter substrate binding protein [Bordetella ansorpii]SAI22239.1 lipoprotein [Bordetella ansorpii]